MDNRPELHITTEWEEDRLLTIECEGGYLTASYNQYTERLLISDVFVEPGFRRNGRATQLVEQARRSAIERGATVIWAAIVSRESLDVMTKIFGEETIEIKHLGEYETEPDAGKEPASYRRTSAMLRAALVQE